MLTALNQLGKLPGPAYECSPGDVRKISQMLHSAVDDLEWKLLKKKSRKPQFSFE